MFIYIYTYVIYIYIYIHRHIHTYTYVVYVYQVVPGTGLGGSFEKRTWLIGIHGELERSELKSNNMHEMNELT